MKGDMAMISYFSYLWYTRFLEKVQTVQHFGCSERQKCCTVCTFWGPTSLSPRRQRDFQNRRAYFRGASAIFPENNAPAYTKTPPHCFRLGENAIFPKTIAAA